MGLDKAILSAHSCATDARQAAREFHAAVVQPDMSLVLFFCSSDYDLEALADEMRRLFPGVPVAGCTTAGEIGPAGYREKSLSGASFAAGSVQAVVGRIDALQEFEIGRGQHFVHALLERLEAQGAEANAGNTFGFLMIDGLSRREELVAHTLQHMLRDLPLVGGSAGDSLRFERSWIYCGGAFHTDAAVLVLVTTALPFKLFKTQHFACDEERLVVTEADPVNRIVKEINGLPAAEEYARRIGVPVSALDPARFAASPVVVLIDGTDYVRSIQKANTDGSLTFYCAIDEGLVLRVAHGEDLVADLERTFDEVRATIGRPQSVIACDCILRNLEVEQQGLKARVSRILADNNAVGFSTYGEQFRGVHINQTITGVAIGAVTETNGD